MTARIFSDDDTGYREWLISHPDGYVVNARKAEGPAYLVLHRARCVTISRASAPPGNWTHRGYKKVCATDLNALRAYVQAQGRSDGSFSNECGFCTR